MTTPEPPPQPAWETWGIAARWNIQHGWHDPITDPYELFKGLLTHDDT